MTVSSLTAGMFSSPAMQQIFSAENTVQRMLDFEAALSRSLALAGLIPEDAVSPVLQACKAPRIDLKALSLAAHHAGNVAIPLVKQLTAEVASIDPKAARYVHWGSTSQDVIDSGMVLQLLEAIDVMSADCAALANTLAQLSERYRNTPVMGRTWLQHALPITFGLKAAGWLDVILRHQQRLHHLRASVAVLQFGGATGSLASLGEQGMTVAADVARLLGLTLPNAPWHAHRDRLAECATVFGLLTGSLGKIARDLSLQMQTEVGELAEPQAPGRGGSTTLPHKRNPVGCAAVLTASVRVPGLVSSLLSGMVNEHERALGGWQAEWDCLPEIACLCGAALTQIRQVLEGLHVDTERMRANIDQTRGLVMAEAVSLALAAHIGRAAAHECIEAACHAAQQSGQTLHRILSTEPLVLQAMSLEELEAKFDPLSYTGSANLLIDRVLVAHRASEA